MSFSSQFRHVISVSFRASLSAQGTRVLQGNVKTFVITKGGKLYGGGTCREGQLYGGGTCMRQKRQIFKTFQFQDDFQ